MAACSLRWLKAQWHEHLKNKKLGVEEHPFELQKLITESIYISVPECGIDGWAKVLGIGKCPQLSPRPGPEFQLVTATFKHQAKQILDVHLHDSNETLGTTPNHPFWSEDQQQFIRADQLQPGKRLRKADGTLTTVQHVTQTRRHFQHADFAHLSGDEFRRSVAAFIAVHYFSAVPGRTIKPCSPAKVHPARHGLLKLPG